MTAEPQRPPIDTFVDALHESACQLATVLAHMETFSRSGRSSPDAPEPVEVLHRLLGEILTPALGRFPDDDLRSAADAVTAATTTVGEELFLVEPGNGAHGQTRRGRRPRR